MGKAEECFGRLIYICLPLIFLTMKHVLPILILLFIGTLSCNKILDRLTTFSYSREATFTIPSTTPVNLPTVFNTPDIQTQFEKEFSANNTKIDLVESIKLKSLTNQILNPANGNFDFVKSIEIYISSDGLADAVVASVSNHMDDGTSAIDFEIADLNLKMYLTQENFKLKARVTTDALITQDYDVTSKATFEVKGKLR